MAENSKFDSLVRSLSKAERKDLWEKIHSEEAPVVNNSPLRQVQDESPINYARAYEQLQLVDKIVLFFKVLFTSITREEEMEQLLLTKMGKKIEREHPDLYEHASMQLLSGFRENIAKMKERFQFLREPYSQAFGGMKQDFFAFMVGWRFPEIQQRLLQDIEPEQVAYEKSLDDPHQVKKEIEYRLEDIIESIGHEQRELLYAEARRFNTLYHLVFFSFERILGSFVRSEIKKRYQAPLNEIKDSLGDLSQVLVTLQDPPSEGMIKVLFLFHLQKELETEASQDIDKRLNDLLRQADQAFNHLRFFNQRVPLVSLIRLARRNLEYVPPEIGGGEDWFVLFKQFWYRRFEIKIKSYIQQQKRKKLIEQAQDFLKTTELPSLQYYGTQLWPDYGNPKYNHSIRFVRGFVDNHFFGDMHGPLKLLLIDGKFYKEQNREEYNDCYNGMLKVQGEINELEIELSPDGEMGKRIERIRGETVSRKQLQMKLEKTVEDTDKKIEQMLSRVVDHLTLLTHLLGGILYGDVGGRYDTLSNLGYIGRNENKNLSQKLSAIKTKIENFLEIYTELFDTERQI